MHKTVIGADELSRFCDSVFASFTRFDQRQWGKVYVRGLVEVEGRKSVRRIGEHVLGRRADQCIQQFVNQSPWDCSPVRHHLADQVTAALAPQAWVVEEVALPKTGRSSVGVERQFAASEGRVLNCQLGISVVAAGARGCVPLNWRLLLPPTWDDDVARRTRARLTDEDKHVPWWCSVLDAIDEMTGRWQQKPLPVIVDARTQTAVDRLVRGLESRGLRYAVRTDPRTPVVSDGLARSMGSGAITLRWWDHRASRPHYVTSHRAGKVIAEWAPDLRRPRSVWLTNLEAVRPPALIELLALRRRAGGDLVELGERMGLRHFEGRSFQGWHHHTTLVSIAHAYRVLHHR
ncbi:IS701 family transposase [Lentzea cavernae]|nr:transposase [Lentzea cavernae]